MIDNKQFDLGNLTLEDVAKKVTAFQKAAATKAKQLYGRILKKDDGEVVEKKCEHCYK